MHQSLAAAGAAASGRKQKTRPPRRNGGGGGAGDGRAVQVDHIKPHLKPPGTKRLTLKYDNSLSILLQFCFQFQLAPLHDGDDDDERAPGDTRPRKHKAKAGRCRSTPGLLQVDPC